MFRGKKKIRTNIGSSSRIEGKFFSQEDIIIEGTVIGKIFTHGNLEVKETGRIKANLEAENIVIAGIVEGNIKAKEKLDIAETSEVYGSIEAKITSIAAGAVLEGECKAGEEKKTDIKEVVGKEGIENLITEEPVKVDIEILKKKNK